MRSYLLHHNHNLDYHHPNAIYIVVIQYFDVDKPYSQTEMHKALFDIARIYSANVIDIDTINVPACSDKYLNYITGNVHPKANYMKAIADKCYKSMINMVFME